MPRIVSTRSAFGRHFANWRGWSKAEAIQHWKFSAIPLEAVPSWLDEEVRKNPELVGGWEEGATITYGHVVTEKMGQEPAWLVEIDEVSGQLVIIGDKQIDWIANLLGK